MDTLEITKVLTEMKTMPRYTMHKGRDTEFYVKSFSITNGKVSIVTSIDKHMVPVKNFGEFIALWRVNPKDNSPKTISPPLAGAGGGKKQEVAKQNLTGAAAKYIHITSPVTVYVTKDYKMFRHTLGNRMLNKNKIKKIVHDIRNGLNRLADYPIVVDPATMEVKDGQHRLEAAISAQEQIYYILAAPMKLHEIARVNSNTERWKSSDFLKCYIDQGNEYYNSLKQFQNDYNFPLSVTLMLLSGFKAHTTFSIDIKNAFEQGRFKTTEKDLLRAKALAEMVLKFKEFKSHNSKSFIQAIEGIKEKNLCDFEQLIEKYKKNPERLVAERGRKEYISSLTLIYNIGKQKIQPIF